MLIGKTEEALGARFHPRAQWLGNRAIYNKARSFDTGGAAGCLVARPDDWHPEQCLGHTGYTLVGYGANEVSTMTGTSAVANKILCLGDLQTFRSWTRWPRRQGDPSHRRAHGRARTLGDVEELVGGPQSNAFRVLVVA
jgi:hypothetical protein